MKKNSLNIVRLMALLLAIALVLSGCNLAVKNLAKQTLDVTKKMAELQGKAGDVEEKVAALSPRDRRTYQEELARLGVEAPEWLFNDAETLFSGAPEKTEETPGGILGLLARIFGGRGGGNRSGGAAPPTEAEIQAALEAAQKILGGGATAPTTPTPVPTPTTEPASGSSSSDGGMTWTVVTDSTFNFSEVSFRAIAYGNGRFVAGGDRGIMAYSSDGRSWTAIEDRTIWTQNVRRSGGTSIYNIVYGNGRFVATGKGSGTDDDNRMAYSDDGISWTRITSSAFGSNSIGNVAYGNGRFIAGAGSGKIAYSTDGASWIQIALELNEGIIGIGNIAYGNGRFIAVGDVGRMAYSSDGVSWTAVANSTIWDHTIIALGQQMEEKAYILATAYGNNRFVAGGYYGKMAYSSDGVNWIAVADSTFGTSIPDSYITEIAYGNGTFVAVGQAGGRMAYSSDGVTWTARNRRLTNINAIAYGNGTFVAVGGGIAYADW